MKLVYSQMRPVWLLQARRQVGHIPAGSFVTSPVGNKRNDSRFSDWFSNEQINPRHFRRVRGFVGSQPIHEIA